MPSFTKAFVEHFVQYVQYSHVQDVMFDTHCVVHDLQKVMSSMSDGDLTTLASLHRVHISLYTGVCKGPAVSTVSDNIHYAIITRPGDGYQLTQQVWRQAQARIRLR